MAGTLSKYALVNAKLRARISKILTEDTFKKLIDSQSLDSTLALLRETPFANLEEIYSRTGDLKLAELELLKKEIALYREIKIYVHENTMHLLDALLYKFEIDNLKNAIRIFFDRIIRKRDIESVSSYLLKDPVIHPIPIDAIANADYYSDIVELCANTPYEMIIRNNQTSVETEKSLFHLEIAFDHFYYKNLVEAISILEKKDKAIATRLIGVEIDLLNINWIIRLKNFNNLPLDIVLSTLIPEGFNLKKSMVAELYSAHNVTSILGEFINTSYPGLSTLLASQASDSTSRLLLIQRLLEEILKYEVRRILAGYPFTIGIMLSYFILKNNELRKIRTIINSKHYNISKERIKGTL